MHSKIPIVGALIWAGGLVVHDRDIRAELADVGRLERPGLELEHDVPQLLDVEEQQVDVNLIQRVE